MKRVPSTGKKIVLLAAIGLFLAPGMGGAQQEERKSNQETLPRMELVNPQGVVQIEPMELNRHPETLEGKTVMLRWNGKHNGNHFLDRIAQLLTEEVKDVKVIKSWEVAPDTAVAISGSQEKSMNLMKKLAALKPDIVIGAQAD